MRGALALLALLAACGPRGEIPGTAGYRDAGVPLASKADFDADRFAGRWHEVAAFPGPAVDCIGAATRWERSATGFDIDRACPGPDGALRARAQGRATVGAYGRLAVAIGGGAVPQWVLWADADYRTAILAWPDGRGAVILDRGRTLPADRRRAALAVLDFNGFETRALVFADPPGTGGAGSLPARSGDAGPGT